MLFVIIHFELIDDLVLDDLFNDVLEGHDADDAVGRVAPIGHLNLCNDANMRETLLEVTEQRLQLIVGGNVDRVSQEDARQLL